MLLTSLWMASSANAGDAVFSGYDVWLTGVNGTATVQSDNTVKLTTYTNTSQKGFVYLKEPIQIKPNTSFSTKFSFAIHLDNLGSNVLYAASGISFILHNDQIGLSPPPVGGMGHTWYQNIMSIAFDSQSSEGTNNLYDDAVFLRENSDESTQLVKVNTSDPVEFVSIDREPRHAWIDYNGENNNIQVFLSVTNAKPATPIINHEINLHEIVGDQAYVGFGAGTGAPSVHTSTHEILDWEFNYTSTLDVAIDIKPGNQKNTINLGSSGVIPVAILSTPDFDALQIDPSSIRLAGAKVKLVGKSDHYLCSQTDINNDGLIDLNCKILTVDFIIEEGDSIATLEANTYGGVDVIGSDVIRIVP